MDRPSSTSAFLNVTIFVQDPTAAFSPSSEDELAFTRPTVTLEERQEPGCLQTVEVPVWYGSDYNTCTMQTTAAPCSVSFPQVSCHTSRPAMTKPSQAMSGTTRLWIVIGVTILLTILIPVVVLWTRWKFRAPRRGGKRSISVQLEKNEAKKSTSPASSAPNRGRNFLDRLLGRNRGIRITNNVNITAQQPSDPPASVERSQHSEEAPLMSPRIALESLRRDHPLHLHLNQPWMQQDGAGRWVPRDEAYLYPGLPPPPRVRRER